MLTSSAYDFAGLGIVDAEFGELTQLRREIREFGEYGLDPAPDGLELWPAFEEVGYLTEGFGSRSISTQKLHRTICGHAIVVGA